MFILSDIITYIRRIIKSPSNESITDSLLIDYINRFYINDVDARLQLFDLKKKYTFVTTPGVDQYNMPLYDYQTESPLQDPQQIQSYPVYQGFLDPCYINGVQVRLVTQKNVFFNVFPNIVQNFQALGVGDGGASYTLQVPILPSPAPQNPPFNALLRGHIDTSGIIAINNAGVQDPPMVTTLNLNVPVTSVNPMVFITTLADDGSNMLVTDSGQFHEENINLGLLLRPGNPPLGNQALPGGYLNNFIITAITLGNPTVITANNDLQAGQEVLILGVVGTTELNNNTYKIITATPTSITIDVDSTFFTPYVSGGVVASSQNVVNYLTGEINVTFPKAVPAGNNINVACYFFASGLPRSILFYNNVITLRAIPALQYVVEMDAYLTPAAFLQSSDAIPFGYMSEYISRGAARKILTDTGDVEQFQFYEPLFREQEMLVWKRSQRQWTATRTDTIYNQGTGSGLGGFNYQGGLF